MRPERRVEGSGTAHLLGGSGFWTVRHSPITSPDEHVLEPGDFPDPPPQCANRIDDKWPWCYL